MEWISIEDELPLENHLIWIYGRLISEVYRSWIGVYKVGRWMDETHRFEFVGVTHWMYITEPKPPAPEIPADIQTIARNLDDMRKWEKGAGE